jgi:hypothetical protein
MEIGARDVNLAESLLGCGSHGIFGCRENISYIM